MANRDVVHSPRGGIPSPSTNVEAAEDAIQQALQGIGGLQLNGSFPFRPGYGSQGREITIFTNHVELVFDAKLELRRFEIKVSPEAFGKKRVQIVKLLCGTFEPGLKDDMVTDFKSILLCGGSHRVPTSRKIAYQAEEENTPSPDATTYTVSLSHSKTLRAADLASFLNSTSPSARYGDKADMVQALNIFRNHYARSSKHLITVGANKVFSLEPGTPTIELGRGLHAIRGFFASVRLATARILVNVQVTHGAFYNAATLDKLMSSFPERRKIERLAVFVKRLRVRLNHLDHSMPRTITALARKNDGRNLPHPPRIQCDGAGAKQVKVWVQEGETEGSYITVCDFFLRKYGLELTQPDVPVINVGSKDNPIYLAPELCTVLPGQPARVELDPGQTQQMIRFAVRKPVENAASILNDGLRTVGLYPGSNPRLRRFGLSTTQSIITVPGRVLPTVDVIYKGKKPKMNPGSWNLRNQRFNIGGHLKKWSALVLLRPSEKQDAFSSDNEGAESLKDTLKRFSHVLRATGIKVDSPLGSRALNIDNTQTEKELYDQRQTQIEKEIEKMIREAAQFLNLLLIILPSRSTPIYNLVKRLGDIKLGIPTVCVVGSLLAKNKDQYFGNVAMKVNLKLGGSNHFVEERRLGLINEGKTMVVGIDVTHPSPLSYEGSPSIAAMVASIDKTLGQWPGVLSIQSRARQEMVSGLKDMLVSRLKLWRTKGGNGALPENILVFRDGVSEGQYRLVREKEEPLLAKACEEVYPPEQRKLGLPRLFVVIVGKRHMKRFYPTKKSEADTSTNNMPGTVVDRGVTEARSWEFYLQAHAALQGTARPAHYFVILDEVFRYHYRNGVPSPFKNVADVVEDLSNSLSYVYGRATKGVSICTPAYFADRLCERARCYLSNTFDASDTSSAGGGSITESWSAADIAINNRLKDTMFYI